MEILMMWKKIYNVQQLRKIEINFIDNFKFHINN